MSSTGLKLVFENQGPNLEIETLEYHLDFSAGRGPVGPASTVPGPEGPEGPEGPVAPIGTFFDHGNSGAAIAIDVQAYTSQRFTVDQNTIFTFTNWPAGVGSVEIIIENAGAFTIDWPTFEVAGGGEEAGFNLTAAGIDTFIFNSKDGGITVRGYQTGEDVKA